jgi:hypothetical protein
MDQETQMAGSYSHLKFDPEAYGGVDTSLCENMGDVIEAMVGMYWMIQILALGDPVKIAAAETAAILIESGQEPPPSFPASGGVAGA